MTPRKLADHFAETDVDDETLLIDLDGGLLFSLSGTGQAVWKAIDGQMTGAELARRMAQTHRGDEAVIAADVEQLLQDFARARLVALDP